jgi:hypothetical protein
VREIAKGITRRFFRSDRLLLSLLLLGEPTTDITMRADQPASLFNVRTWVLVLPF